MRPGAHRELRFSHLALLALVLAMFSVSTPNAAEISCGAPYGYIDAERRTRLLKYYPSGRLPNADTCGSVLIKGPIEIGDSAKFYQRLQKNHPFLYHIYLWSPGGSAPEAIKIGQLIRKALIKTSAPGPIFGGGQIGTTTQSDSGMLFDPNFDSNATASSRSFLCRGKGCHCASACFLIWAAGVERSGNTLGLHRPSTNAPEFANSPPAQASEMYRRIVLAIDQYLSAMEIPRRYIEMMTDTSSIDMRWLTIDEASEMSDVPSIHEWIKSSGCEPLSKLEFERMASPLERDRQVYDSLLRKMLDYGSCSATKLAQSRDAIVLP